MHVIIAFLNFAEVKFGLGNDGSGRPFVAIAALPAVVSPAERRWWGVGAWLQLTSQKAMVSSGNNVSSCAYTLLSESIKLKRFGETQSPTTLRWPSTATTFHFVLHPGGWTRSYCKQHGSEEGKTLLSG